MKSIIRDLADIKVAKRWDFGFHAPEYLQVLASLDSIYPVVRFGDIITVLTDMGAFSLYKTEFFVDAGVPFLRVQNIQEYGVDLEKDTKFISYEYHQQLERSQLRPGDLLLTTKAVIGISAVVNESLGNCNISQNLVLIRLKDGINPNYVSVFLNSHLGRMQTETAATGPNQKYLNFERIYDLKITLPPRSFQDQIAQVMQEAYGDQRKKLEEAETSFLGIEAYVHEVLEITRNLPIDEPRFLVNQSQLHRWDVRFFLPSFSHLEDFIEKGKYLTKPLLAVCEKITNGLTPAKIGYTDEGCVVVKVASLTKLFQINWDKVAFTSTEFFKKAKKAHIKDGDLLILSASHQLDYIGRSFALVRDIPADYIDQCMAVGELILIRSNPQIVLPEYLLTCFMMQPIQKLINRMTRGQSAHLYAEDLKHLKIPLPPLDVQQMIVGEMDRRRGEVKRLRTEAAAVIAVAKAQVERMILGEEAIDQN